MVITTDSSAAAGALDEAIVGLASHRASTPSSLARALELDPGLVVGHVLTGFAAKLLARRDRVARAHAAAAEARSSFEDRGGTERERLLIEALDRWCALDPEGAVALLDRVLEVEPLDLLAIKLSHALQFMLGHSVGMRRSIERVLPAWQSAQPADGGLVHGCWAFALVETGELQHAEKVGRAALERAPLDPWGAHAVAHVLHTKGRAREGLAWIDHIAGCLDGANNFAAHVHWHGAVLLVALGRLDEALSLHDRAIAIDDSVDYRDFVNSVTLLYRLERAGLAVGDRWERLAPRAIEHIGDHALAFADAHYVLALVGAGYIADAERFTASMRAHAARTEGLEAGTMREVGVLVADALVTMRRDPTRAAELLAAREAQLGRLGGSRAQREIFALLRADAAERVTAIDAVRTEQHQPS